MSRLINDSSLLKNLETEKINVPALSEPQKRQLSNNVIEKALQQPVASFKTHRGSFHYFLIAALVVLGVCVLLIISKQPDIVKSVPIEVVSQNPEISHALVFQDMVEKWDPDVLGGVASQFLIAKANPIMPFDKELKAFHTLGSGLISSFYEEFTTNGHVEEN
jgi:hypothetical protein